MRHTPVSTGDATHAATHLQSLTVTAVQAGESPRGHGGEQVTVGLGDKTRGWSDEHVRMAAVV